MKQNTQMSPEVRGQVAFVLVEDREAGHSPMPRSCARPRPGHPQTGNSGELPLPFWGQPAFLFVPATLRRRGGRRRWPRALERLDLRAHLELGGRVVEKAFASSTLSFASRPRVAPHRRGREAGPPWRAARPRNAQALTGMSSASRSARALMFSHEQGTIKQLEQVWRLKISAPTLNRPCDAGGRRVAALAELGAELCRVLGRLVGRVASSAARGGHACARTPRSARPPLAHELARRAALRPRPRRRPRARLAASAAGARGAVRRAQRARRRRADGLLGRRAALGSRRATSSPSSATSPAAAAARAELSFETSGRRLAAPRSRARRADLPPPAPPAAPPAASPPARRPPRPPPLQRLCTSPSLHNLIAATRCAPRRRGRRGRRQLRRGVGVAASARCRLPDARRARAACTSEARAPVWRV